jgi:hypothetical protein
MSARVHKIKLRSGMKYPKTELLRAVIWLVANQTGRKQLTLKALREKYAMWWNSNFLETMNFGEFLFKMESKEPERVPVFNIPQL